MAFYTQLATQNNNNNSAHFLEIENTNILIDTGFIQKGELNNEYKITSFDPSLINFIIITNVQTYNLSNLVLLIKHGFKGKIISLDITYDIIKMYLLHYAKIYKQSDFFCSKEELIKTFKLFLKPLKSLEQITLKANIQLKLKNNPYLLGSSYVEIKTISKDSEKRIVFAEDITHKMNQISHYDNFFKEAHQLFISHSGTLLDKKNLEINIDYFKNKIIKTLENNNTVILCLEDILKAQETLFMLQELINDKALKNTPIFLDSSIITYVNKIFNNYPTLFNQKVNTCFSNELFTLEDLIYIEKEEQALIIDKISGAKIILLSLNQYEQEKTLNYLLKNIQEKNNSIFFIGNLEKNSPLNKLLKTSKYIKINNIKYKVNAKIEHYESFEFDNHLKILEQVHDLEYLERIYFPEQESVYLNHFKSELIHTLKKKVQIVSKNSRIFI